jgi:hypothetical protein
MVCAVRVRPRSPATNHQGDVLPWDLPACSRKMEYDEKGDAMGRRTRSLLMVLLLFNGASAAGGGIALMTGLIPEQPSWVEHTDFPSLYLPGVVLLALVGGSSFIAALALARPTTGWQLCSIVAGVVMLVWIVGEVASIRGFHVLQVVYVCTGGAVLWCVLRAGVDLVEEQDHPG